MSHRSTDRVGLEPAPEGLALVQDLLNTRAIGPHGTDLLASVDEARRWLHDVLDPPAVDPPAVDPPAVAPDHRSPDHRAGGARGEGPSCRGSTTCPIRSDLERLVPGAATLDTGPALIRTTMTVSPAGELALHPAGRGPGWFISAVWVQVCLAQQKGTWRRLKLCHNPPCGSAFYDRSTNNSGVWHDVRVCGKAANLRASRARRLAADHQSPAR